MASEPSIGSVPSGWKKVELPGESVLVSHPPDWSAFGGSSEDGSPAFIQLEPPDNIIPDDVDSKFQLTVQIDPPEGAVQDVVREMRAELARGARIDGLKWTEQTGWIGSVPACILETRSSLVAPPGGITETQRCDCITRDYLADWLTGGVLRIRASVIYPEYWEPNIETVEGIVASVRQVQK